MDLSLGFNLVPMINVSDFVPIIFCFYYHSSVDQLEIENRNIFCSCFLILDYFGYAELFFPYEDEFCLFKVCKDLCWKFDWDCIDSADYFWKDYDSYYVDSTDGLTQHWTMNATIPGTKHLLLQ